MDDPRILLTRQPVDEPLMGEASEALGRALRAPVDEPLWGSSARITGALLTGSRGR